MVDTTLATTSLLNSSYGLQAGSSAVQGLLAPKASNAFSGLSTLQSSYGATSLSTSQSSLVNFIKDNVPNNGQLLKNLDAVFALQNILGNPQLSSTAAFINPYTQALALGDSANDGSSTTSLLSLIS